MHFTTLPSHSSFSQKILVSFVMEINTTSIDFLTLITAALIDCNAAQSKLVLKLEEFQMKINSVFKTLLLKGISILLSGINKWYLLRLFAFEKLLLEDMDQDSAHMVVASKVPMLKPGKFKLWRMRIEQYIQMIDYAL
ncbi:hypothetical protein Tco_0992506 [Tanacetum coccineum]|uniref:Uncharacterized protein n=1 Tax=Tanacetum coccineum TaxID=301880 RepID=A0ABQ5F2K5_9ASTR